MSKQFKNILVILIFFPVVTVAEKKDEATVPKSSFQFVFENALAWQSSNVNQIPNSDQGTRFDIADFSKGASYAPRFYFSYAFNENHSLRALVFPFQAEGDKVLSEELKFDGKSFAPGINLNAKYKFYSYRLTYQYRLLTNEDWELKIGFTAKIRNAAVELSQGATQQKYSNVGFVPLLYFNAKYFLSPIWHLELDMDALAAPQGRAEDISVQAWYTINPTWRVGGGYRTLEGGADNSKVYTFAWLHFITLSTSVVF